MSKVYDINVVDSDVTRQEFLDFLCSGVCGSVIDTKTGMVRAAIQSELDELLYRQHIEESV